MAVSTGPSAVLLVRNGVSHDARVLRAAGVLRHLGFAVTIVGSITASSPAREETIAGHSVVRLRARSPFGVLSRLFGGRLPGPLGRLHRTLTALDWNRRALVVIRSLRPELIHANDYNTMWPALIACRLWGARVVYDSHELWADRNGRPEWRGWLVWAERGFLRRADAVITASPGYADELAKRYRVRRPTVVRNVPSWTASRSAPPRRGDLVYLGGLLRGRGLELAIDALALLDDGASLRMIGPGNVDYVASLLGRAVAAGVGDRVTHIPAVAPQEIPEVLAGAWAGLSLIEPVGLSYELTLPNKVLEYLALGIPSLVTPRPVQSELVARLGIGVVTAGDDAPSVATGLALLMREEVRSTLAKACAVASSGLNWPNESQVLTGVYQRVNSLGRGLGGE